MPDGSFDPLAILKQGSQGKFSASAGTATADDSAPSYSPVIDVGSNLDRNAAPGEPGSELAPTTAGAGKPADPNAMPVPTEKPFDPLQVLKDGARGKFDYTPPTQPEKSTFGGIANNVAAGANSNIAGLLGLPVDAMQGAINLPLRGLNALGADVPLLDNSAGSSSWIKQHLPQVGIPNPDDVQTHGNAEQVARGLGGAVASVPTMGLGAEATLASGATQFLPKIAGPVLQSLQAASVPSAVVPAAAGSVAGTVASQKVPDWLKPYADVAGNFAGGMGAGLAQEAVRGGVNAVGSALGARGIGSKQSYGGQQLTGAQADEAASTVSSALGPQGRNMLANNDEQLVPGSQQTLGQVVPTPGVLGLEKAYKTNGPAPEAFVQRYSDQNNARLAHIAGAAPGDANTGAVAPWLQSLSDNIDAVGKAAIEHQGANRAGTGLAMAGKQDAEDIGAAGRAAIAGPQAAEKAAAGKMFNALDPDRKWALDTGPIKEAHAKILAEMPRTGKPLEGEEKAIFDAAANLPSVEKFSEIKGLMSRTWAEMRAIRADPKQGAESPAFRRLSMLNEAYRDAMVKAAADQEARDAAGVSSGAMAPEATMLARLNGEGVSAGGGVVGKSGLAEGSVGGNSVSIYRGGENPGATAGLSERPGSQDAGNGGGRLGAGNRQMAPAATDGRITKPQSLVDALIAKGGIKGDGDLTAMGLNDIHHRQGGRLINPNGMSLEHATEFAKENGFMPDTFENDINALKVKLEDHASGRPTYRPEDEAQAAAWKQGLVADNIRADAMERAAGKVSDVERGLGGRLSQAEHDHATELTARGMDPEEAIRAATLHSEQAALDVNAAHNAIGSPGVPLAAQQASMPISGGPRIEPNFDAAALEKTNAANARYAEYKGTYRTGVVGDLLREGATKDSFKVPDSRVFARIFNGAGDEGERAAAYLKATGGSSEGIASARDGLISDLRQSGILAEDGTLNAKKFETWQNDHRRGIQALDEAAGGTHLQDMFADHAASQQAVDHAEAAYVQQRKLFDKSSAATVLGFGPDESDKAIAKVFGTRNTPNAGLDDLAQKVRPNEAATAGLKRMVTDFIANRLTGATATSDDNNLLRADQFQKFIQDNKSGLRSLFGGQGTQNFQAVAADLRRANFASDAMKGSQTAPLLGNAARHGVGQGGHASTPLTLIFEALGEGLGHVAGGEYGSLVGRGVGAALPTIVNKFRQAGIHNTQKLVSEMLLNPSLAREVMAARVNAEGTIGPVAQRKIVMALRAGNAVAASQAERKMVDRK